MNWYKIEFPFEIIYHEFIERYLMKHKNMSYDDAHDIANKNEKKRIK
jgi:5-methylcytosine-specific restriction endonuclease McrBC regulatory subunit McrC